MQMDSYKFNRTDRLASLKRDASADLDLPKAECRARYIVCSTQRTGSSLVCRALQDTGRAGQPMEFLHPSLLKAFLARFGRRNMPAPAYHEFLETHRTTANGVFGVKVHMDQLLTSYADNDRRLNFLKRFDHAIYVSRASKLAQAVSYARALQTQHWEADNPEAAALARRAAIHYDMNSIAKQLHRFVEQEAAWASLLREAGIPCLKISYEEITDDFSASMLRVAGFLQLDDFAAEDFALPPLMKLGDDSNMKWGERFVADIQGQPHVEH